MSGHACHAAGGQMLCYRCDRWQMFCDSPHWGWWTFLLLGVTKCHELRMWWWWGWLEEEGWSVLRIKHHGDICKASKIERNKRPLVLIYSTLHTANLIHFFRSSQQIFSSFTLLFYYTKHQALCGYQCCLIKRLWVLVYWSAESRRLASTAVRMGGLRISDPDTHCGLSAVTSFPLVLPSIGYRHPRRYLTYMGV